MLDEKPVADTLVNTNLQATQKTGYRPFNRPPIQAVKNRLRLS
ncbi:protein of unknown function [Vibrio tapetis subsp. tapetis]|uniref:Uncharacterized protein n=1 Tax=Vibrio tapetis subsp. tapetis TaxID=1671868 RepID=A0A2N8ZD40_9VIBR|nr:protein of unknown function [Vibrio tapetis subsp. tapetis]